MVRWQGPDDRELLVYNGMHYHFFGLVSRYFEGSTADMQVSLDAYLDRLRSGGHPHDFVMLSCTYPQTSDNFPPDPRLAEMVHRWNSEERTPALRFATPEMVLERMRGQPAASGRPTAAIGRITGTLAASSANETRLNRESADRLLAAQMLQAGTGPLSEEDAARTADAYFNLNLFDEHPGAATEPWRAAIAIRWTNSGISTRLTPTGHGVCPACCCATN